MAVLSNVASREFFKLAGVYLACRLKVMGGQVANDRTADGLKFQLLGMHDYDREMGLLLREVKETRSIGFRATGPDQK